MPGLAGFDANAAAQNLAAVGQPTPMLGPPVALAAPVAPQGPLFGPPVPAGVGPVEGPPAPPGADTTQIVQPPAPIAPGAPGLAPGAPPPIVPTGDIPGIQAASVAQQKAAGETGAAEADLAKAKSDEERKAADIQGAEAEELRQTNERQQRAQDEAHRQTEAALNEAHATTIPAFFGSNEGKRAETAMWVGLGGIAQGLLGAGTNGAADIVSKNIDAYYRREKDRVDNLYTFAAKKGEAEGELRLQHTQELAGLQAQYGATKLAIASRIDAMATAGQGRIDQAKAQELAAKYAMEGQKDIEDAQYKLAQINHLNAQAAREMAKAKGSGAGGGAGRGEAYDKFREAVLANAPNVGALASAAGIKPKDIEGQRLAIAEEEDKRKKLGGEAAKAGASAGGVDPKLVIRDVDGHPLGLASSARNVETVKKDIRNFTDAVKRLTILKNTKYATKLSPEFHAAVGALAATTPGGQTDTNTAHEAGTLMRYGLVNNSAIDAQIEDINERLRQQKAQLTPLPAGYGASAPSSGENIPAGAKVGVQKSTGKRGYMLNGVFTPL